MFGNDPGEDGDGLDRFPQFRIRHALQRLAGNDILAAGNSDFFGNGGSGHPIIPGDHNHADARAAADGNIGLDACAGRIGKPHQPQQRQAAVGDGSGDGGFVFRMGARNGDDPQSLRGKRSDLCFRGIPLRVRQFADHQDALRTALGGNDQLAVPAPDVSHHFQFIGKGVFPYKRIGKQALLGNAMRLTTAEHGLFHGVVSVGFAAEPHRLDKRLLGTSCHPSFLYGHLVHGDGTGLIYAEHRNSTQRLHAGQLAHQRVFLGQPPRPHGEKYRKNDRKLFRNHGHGKRHTGKNAFNQTIGKRMVGNIEPCEYGHQGKQRTCYDGAGFHQLAGLFLQRRILLRRGGDAEPDFSVFGLRTDLTHLNRGGALCDEGAGIAAITAPVILCGFGAFRRDFPDPLCFAGKGGFIHTQIGTAQHYAVRRNLDALADHHQIARHQIGTCDLLFFAVPHDGDVRCGQILQRMECLVGFPLLNHINADDACHKNKHNRTVSRLSENEINNCSGNEQQKHRLTDNVEYFFEKAFLLLRRQFVFAVFVLQSLCFGRG